MSVWGGCSQDPWGSQGPPAPSLGFCSLSAPTRLPAQICILHPLLKAPRRMEVLDPGALKSGSRVGWGGVWGVGVGAVVCEPSLLLSTRHRADFLEGKGHKSGNKKSFCTFSKPTLRSLRSFSF